MAMWRVQRCTGCGAALPRGDRDDPAITCRFCGLTIERAQLRPLIVRWDIERSIRQLGRRAKLAVLLGLVVAAGVVAFAILRAARPITDALHSLREQSDKIEESLRPVAPNALATIEPGVWRAVEVTPPKGGLAVFDPVGGMEWVLDVARSWAVDAALEQIEGGPIARDGTMNLAAEGEAFISYEFLAPQRLAQWDREADLRRDVAADYELEVAIAHGRVTARVTRGRPLNVKVPPAGPLLAVGELLARARRNGFPDRPFYVGTLRHSPRQGWQWHLQTPSGRDSFPRLIATGEVARH